MPSFEPNGNRLLLRDVKVDVKHGGIIIPDAALERRFEQECEVLAVGPKCSAFEVGDTVLVHVNDGLKTTLNGEPVRIYFEEKVLGRLALEKVQ